MSFSSSCHNNHSYSQSKHRHQTKHLTASFSASLSDSILLHHVCSMLVINKKSDKTEYFFLLSKPMIRLKLTLLNSPKVLVRCCGDHHLGRQRVSFVGFVTVTLQHGLVTCLSSNTGLLMDFIDSKKIWIAACLVF